jgi:transcriptional regulator with XRE-family HTH domain
MERRQRNREWDELVGKNLRRLRTQKGMSQEELGGEANISARHVGRIERAELSASVEVLGGLACALGVNPAVFFER